MHIKGPVTEVRLTNEGEIGGGRGGDAAEEEVGTTALGASARGGGGVGASNNGVMLHVQLAGIGICLVDGEPRELLYVSLSSLRLRANRTDTQQSLEVKLAHLQVDASVPSTKFPVMLAPQPGQVSDETLSDERHGAQSSMASSFARVPRIRRRVRAATAASARAEYDLAARPADRFARQGAAQRELEADPRRGRARERIGCGERRRQRRRQEGGRDDQEGRRSSGRRRWRRILWNGVPPRELPQVLHPGADPPSDLASTTVQMDIACDDSALQPFHPTQGLHGLIGGGMRHLLSLQNVHAHPRPHADGGRLRERRGDRQLAYALHAAGGLPGVQAHREQRPPRQPRRGSLRTSAAACDEDEDEHEEGRPHQVALCGDEVGRHLTQHVVGGTGAFTFGATSGMTKGSALYGDDGLRQEAQLPPADCATEGGALGQAGDDDGAALLGGGVGVRRRRRSAEDVKGARGWREGLCQGRREGERSPSCPRSPGMAGGISKVAEGFAAAASTSAEAVLAGHAARPAASSSSGDGWRGFLLAACPSCQIDF